MNQEEIAAKNLIYHYGSQVSINSYSRLTSDCDSGSLDLKLNSTVGLISGVELTIGEENIKIRDVNKDGVTLIYPVSVSHKTDTVIYSTATTFGKPVPRSSGRSRAEDEYSDRIRVSVDTPVSNGSFIHYDDRNFLVTGLDKGSNTIELILREVNVTFSIVNPNSENYNGFGYDITDGPIAANLPGCLNFLNESLTPDEVGQVPATRRNLLYPSAYRYNKDYIYIINGQRFRPTGLAELVMKNLNVVILDYDIKS